MSMLRVHTDVSQVDKALSNSIIESTMCTWPWLKGLIQNFKKISNIHVSMSVENQRIVKVEIKNVI